MDDKTTIDDYIQKSRFKIPNCYQIPISSVSNIIGLNTKKVSENMPIPLVSPNEQVSTDILLNSNDKSSCNLFQSSNSPLTKNQLMDNSCILESHNYQQHNNTNLSLNEEARNVDFYVLDAPYHTMESAVELGIIAEDIPFLPVSFAKWAGNVVLKVKEPLTYDDIQPVDAVKNISVPVLLIHGTDEYAIRAALEDSIHSWNKPAIEFDPYKYNEETAEEFNALF